LLPLRVAEGLVLAAVHIVIVFTMPPMASLSLNHLRSLSKISVCLRPNMLDIDLDPCEILLESMNPSHQFCKMRLSKMCQM
jgi:hypothetical protein